jgi:hypothetical protein
MQPGKSMKDNETRSAAERLLDQAIECTFPASDPIAVAHAFASALKRDEDDASDPAQAREGGHQ